MNHKKGDDFPRILQEFKTTPYWVFPTPPGKNTTRHQN